MPAARGRHLALSEKAVTSSLKQLPVGISILPFYYDDYLFELSGLLDTSIALQTTLDAKESKRGIV